jgi:hypothetical protein
MPRKMVRPDPLNAIQEPVMPEVALISGRDFRVAQKIATICPASEFIRGILDKSIFRIMSVLFL